jgi:peptide/nickel transport system permease protein
MNEVNNNSSRGKIRRRKFFKNMFSRKIVIVGTSFVVLFVLMAIFVEVLAPYPPNEQDFSRQFLHPSAQHWLGTDMYGRDVLSRVIYGSRISLIIGVIAVTLATVVGCGIGMISAYKGGIVDIVIQRLVETFYSIPQTVITLALCAVFGNNLVNLTILLAISTIPGYVRMMRAQVLLIKQQEYVTAAKVIGCPDKRLMLKHLLPNSISPIIVMLTQNVGGTIIAEAGLSFLGLGVAPPTATWGTLIADGREFLTEAPALALGPGFAIILLVIGLNMMGDGLRDAMDPRLRGTK